jgi:hypothetical protein
MHLNLITVALKIWGLQRLKEGDDGKIRLKKSGKQHKKTLHESKQLVYDGIPSRYPRNSATVLFSSLPLSLNVREQGTT